MKAHECCQYDGKMLSSTLFLKKKSRGRCNTYNLADTQRKCNLACYVLQITFTAKAGQPVKLEPETIPATPTVSNTQRNNSRVLVKTLKLQLKVFFINIKKT